MESVAHVIDISHSASYNGHDWCTITITDGNYFMDCYLAPQLIYLVRNAILKKFAVLSIRKVICCHISVETTLIINELVVISENPYVINLTIPYADVQNRCVVASSLHGSTERNVVDAASTRRKFIVMHENFVKILQRTILL
jgi:hypothetical protein